MANGAGKSYLEYEDKIMAYIVGLAVLSVILLITAFVLQYKISTVEKTDTSNKDMYVKDVDWQGVVTEVIGSEVSFQNEEEAISELGIPADNVISCKYAVGEDSKGKYCKVVVVEPASGMKADCLDGMHNYVWENQKRLQRDASASVDEIKASLNSRVYEYNKCIILVESTDSEEIMYKISLMISGKAMEGSH